MFDKIFVNLPKILSPVDSCKKIHYVHTQGLPPDLSTDFALVILDLHTLIYCQGMINQYVLLASPRSLLSTFSLNVLILLLSVAGILVLLQ